MLQLQQIKDLLAAHIPVQHHSANSVVFDYHGKLYRSEPEDEAGEGWEPVDGVFAAPEYSVYPSSAMVRYHEVPELDWDSDRPPALTKVVKFPDPEPQAEKLRPVPHLVVLTFKDADVTDEEATEKAIDYLLNIGWTEVQAQPLLVI